jgi:hypothetical protein
MNDLRIQHLSFSGEAMTVAFSDEHSIVVSVRHFPRLHSALPLQREQWQLIGRGLGVHWEALDEDLSVENLLLAYSRNKAGQYSRASHS